MVTSAFLLCSCGGARQEANSPDGSDREGGVGRASEPAAPRNLKPAQAPAGVVARFRVQNMAQLADGLMEAASIPFDWRRILEEGRETGVWVAAVDWEGSVEAVAAMNIKQPQRPHGAFSVGVRGIGPVLGLLEQKNVGAVEGPGEVFYFEVSGDNCAVGPALGSSPARVVCANSRSSLDLLLPYALRGLPEERLSSADVHMQFDMEPLRAAYGKELKTFLRWAPAAARSQHQGNRTFDSALSDGAVELSREGSALVDELQRVTVQIDEESGDFTGTVDVDFKGETSDVSKVLLDFEERQKELPAIFDEIPSSASSAGYSREISGKYAKKWVSIVADLIQGGAELDGVSRAVAKRLGSVVKQLGPDGETGVYARGPLVTSGSDGGEGLRSAWVLSGTTRKKADVVKLFDDIGWLLSSQELRKMNPETPAFPELKRKNLAVSGAAGATVFEWNLPPELMGLARLMGAQMDADLEIGDPTEGLKDLESGLIAVHQIGDVTWISWGKTRQELVESFSVLTEKDVERLGSLGDLGGVRGEPAVTAGFARLDALVGMTSFLFPGGLLDDWTGLKAAMPNRASVPVLYSFRVKRAENTTASWRIHVPAEFTQDLAALGVMLAQKRGVDMKTMKP